MQHAAGPHLVVIGNFLLDDIVYADGRTRMGQPGGAALYVALGAALWGVPVGVVTRLGDDYPKAVTEALASRGIAIAGGGGRGGLTLRTWLLYEGRRRRVVHRLDGPTHAAVSPRATEIPLGWRPRAVHLAPMPWEVQREIIEEVGPRTSKAGCRISADPYELLTPEHLARWREVFGRIDTLFLSEDEMQIPAALDRPRPVLEQLGEGAPRLGSIFYKRGAAGGLVWRRDRSEVTEWAPRATTVVDPTGAGDAFAGGVLAGALAGDPLARRLGRGVVSAGFALCAAGADGLFAATQEDAAAHLEAATRGSNGAAP